MAGLFILRGPHFISFQKVTCTCRVLTPASCSYLKGFLRESGITPPCQAGEKGEAYTSLLPWTESSEGPECKLIRPLE
jgi:hypothetical protein